MFRLCPWTSVMNSSYRMSLSWFSHIVSSKSSFRHSAYRTLPSCSWKIRHFSSEQIVLFGSVNQWNRGVCVGVYPLPESEKSQKFPSYTPKFAIFITGTTVVPKGSRVLERSKKCTRACSQPVSLIVYYAESELGIRFAIIVKIMGNSLDLSSTQKPYRCISKQP